jgi:hypothetical protein
MIRSLLTAALLLAPLSACAPQVQAPADTGVCWHMVPAKGGKVRFILLSKNQPDLEHCAANLEAMRLKFLGMGGSNQEVDGAFQGQFIFDDPRGIFTAEGLDKTPYLALVRTGDGRLAVPGAVPQDQ